MSENDHQPLSLFLCGDLMTGRGIDQTLPHPSDAVLYETCVRDAREYVQLAEQTNGLIARPVGFKYIWGDALGELQRSKPDVRITNLETSITCSEDRWAGKGIHYRMHPQNVGCLTAARIDVCCLANNHVMDWGREGLAETLRTLDAAGLAHAGAGRNAEEAAAPAVLTQRIERSGGPWRVLVFSFGATTSGIPREWAAGAHQLGVNLLPDFSEATARRLAHQVRQIKQPGDVAVASIHWGANWGYTVSSEEIDFAHRLVEAGFDIVHGHSSHHVKAIEVFNERLILYGCGDFINDYEGIGGYESFRGDLALMYLATVETRTGRLLGLRLVPLQRRRFRLWRASPSDARWLRDLLNALGEPFGTRARLGEDDCLSLVWAGAERAMRA